MTDTKRHLRSIALALTAAVAAAVVPCSASQSTPVRIKDIAQVAGTSGQQLMGYGLVIGLEGSGDRQPATLTAQALANMLEHFDLKVVPTDLTTKNVAAVIATASLPCAARDGDKIDLTVASVGDATSLYGGILLPTPLIGNDREVYAIAQGPVSIGGINASSGGAKVQKNHPVAGRLVGGATIVKTVTPTLERDRIHLTLRQPDFTTALRISQAINEKMETECAKAVAAESVEISVPEDRADNLIAFIAELESLPVEGDAAARVVVNERTGTVIIGGDVRVMPVAIAHGSITITVKRRTNVSQPEPFTGGTTVLRSPQEGGEGETGTPPGRVAPLPGARTVVTEETELTVEEAEASLVEIRPQTQLRDLVEALNALGVKPRDLIAILQALKAANALQAELVLM